MVSGERQYRPLLTYRQILTGRSHASGMFFEALPRLIGDRLLAGCPASHNMILHLQFVRHPYQPIPFAKQRLPDEFEGVMRAFEAREGIV